MRDFTLLDFIAVAMIRSAPPYPKLREIAAALGGESIKTAQARVQRLCKAGIVKRKPKSAYTLRAMRRRAKRNMMGSGKKEPLSKMVDRRERL